MKLCITSDTKSDARYDILKFVMSIMVLAIHSELYPNLFYPWLRTAVPLFFIITAYFLFTKLDKADGDKQKDILKHFVVRNTKLYGYWFLILLPLTLYIRRGTYFSGGIIAGLTAFFRGLFFGSTFVASWYIPASVIGILIVFFAAKHIRSRFLVLLFCVFCFCIVTLQSSYSSLIEGTLLSRAIQIYLGIFGGLVCSFPASFIWVLIGRAFARKSVPSWISRFALPIFLFSCLGLYAEWRYVMHLSGAYNNDSYFMLLPVCTSFFAFIQSCKPIHLPISKYLRHASTVIYVSHGSLVYSIAFVLRHLFHTDIPFVTFSSTLFFCLILHFFIEWASSRFSHYHIARFIRSLY